MPKDLEEAANVGAQRSCPRDSTTGRVPTDGSRWAAVTERMKPSDRRPETKHGPRLHRVLGTMDLALLSVAAIVGLRWLSFAAQIRAFVSLVLWLLGLAAYMGPMALAVLELSSRAPGEGGLYLWSKAAFGDAHGFIAGWAFWTSNLVFFPSLLLFGAGGFLYVGGASWLSLGESTLYNATFCLAALWFATGLNIVGLKRAKWLSDVGGMATWIVGGLVILAGAIAWITLGPATPITPTNIVPDFTAMATLTAFATIALAYEGLELGPIMGGEIKDPRRTITRATLIAALIVAVIYIAGTAALMIALPPGTIDTINGVPQAAWPWAMAVHIPAFGTITALLIAIASVGGLGAWIAGTARLPFVFGLDRYLPPAMGRLHPTFETPHIALIVQGVIVTIILAGALSGSAIHDAFLILLDMTIILSLAPLLYIFASLPVLRWRARGNNEGVMLIPGGLVSCTLVAALGFATTLLAITVSMIPPAGTDATLFSSRSSAAASPSSASGWSSTFAAEGGANAGGGLSSAPHRPQRPALPHPSRSRDKDRHRSKSSRHSRGDRAR